MHESLSKLKEGNDRFASGNSIHPNLSAEVRNETLVNGQKPFAAVVSCADSRCPVDLVFDQGIGDMFSVRTAGNVLDGLAMGSLELGVYKFDIPLVVVLGHTDCGAIKLAIDGKELPGEMQGIIEKIMPAIEEVQQKFHKLNPEMLEYEVTAANMKKVIDEISNSEVIKKRIDEGKSMVIGGIHQLDSGVVEWFE